mmetsp:Transcript_82151/g.229005  ORF Transcript_82151/g.229005 Transcript_82151/m.229005 type:complete len:254 (+) Transcript_82151:179-940(+)
MALHEKPPSAYLFAGQRGDSSPSHANFCSGGLLLGHRALRLRRGALALDLRGFCCRRLRRGRWRTSRRMGRGLGRRRRNAIAAGASASTRCGGWNFSGCGGNISGVTFSPLVRLRLFPLLVPRPYSLAFGGFVRIILHAEAPQQHTQFFILVVSSHRLFECELGHVLAVDLDFRAVVVHVLRFLPPLIGPVSNATLPILEQRRVLFLGRNDVAYELLLEQEVLMHRIGHDFRDGLLFELDESVALRARVFFRP